MTAAEVASLTRMLAELNSRMGRIESQMRKRAASCTAEGHSAADEADQAAEVTA
jgi:hypothetical protein